MLFRSRIAIEMKGWSTGMKGDWEEALKFFEEVYRLTNHPLKGLSGLGVAYASLGLKEKAMECIHKIEQRQAEEPDAVLDGDLLGIWYHLGDLDKAFYHLEQCIEKRMSAINFWLEFPAFRKLKQDPRYGELKKKAELQSV